MAVQLTEEQRHFTEAVDQFCAKELATREQRGSEPFNRAVAQRMAGLGWLGVSIPEEFGGSGGGLFDACLFVESIAYGRAPIMSFPVTLIVAATYRKFAPEAVKHQVLKGIAGGAVESIAMSEPGSGSDVASLTCRAERENGGYILNGQKTWCSNAHLADHILVVARTSSKGAKHEGISMLSVPKETPGMEIRPIDTMGGKEVNDVFLTDCHVDAARLVGTEGQGWAQLIAGLNIERVIIGAMYLGLARRAFDDTLAYVKEREQFGRPIGRFQALAHRLADLATEITATKLLVYDVAREADANPEQLLPREASMAKLKATELAKAAALEGLQMMGGYGYATEYEMEALVRGAVVGTIVGGTSEIQRDIIAKTYGL